MENKKVGIKNIIYGLAFVLSPLFYVLLMLLLFFICCKFFLPGPGGGGWAALFALVLLAFFISIPIYLFLFVMFAKRIVTKNIGYIIAISTVNIIYVAICIKIFLDMQ